MEHLRTPNCNPTNNTGIEIPLVGTLEYDGGDFHTYPERRGWTEEMIYTRRDFGYESAVAVETFFQTWLYFGFLTCTFRIVGISVDTADFLSTSEEGNKIITTQRLPQYLQRWRQRDELARARDSLDTRDLHWPSVLKILQKVYDYTNRYCNEYSQKFAIDAKQMNAQACPISPQVSLSIIALGRAFTAAATTIYNIPQADLQMAWGTSSLLRKRLYDLGWCPKDISMLSDSRDAVLEVQYHLTTVPYSRASIDHLRCTESECSGERVDTDHYVTQHVNSGCQCADLQVEERVLGVLRQGGMPLVAFRTYGLHRSPTVEVVDYKSQSPASNKHVAISHVWADGLGNRLVNGLPICQLNRLQTLVNDLYNTHPEVSSRYRLQSESSTRFWIDTLCVPLHDDECRRSAISEMRSVYQLADRVLVLDSWIMKGSVHDTIFERSIRLMMSNWTRRLWTLSEAVLSKNLYIQFGEASVHTEKLIIDCRAHYLNSAAFYDNSTAHVLAMSLPILWFGSNVPISKRFDALVYHIGQRTTSWPSDETICFSNLLGLSTKLLLEISRADLKVRMTRFLRMVGTFRQQIIFDDGPRCQAEGFGWAPASFLNRLGTIVVTDRGEGDGRVGNLDPCGGLLVTYSGIRLHSLGASPNDRFFISLRNQSNLGLFCTLRIDDYYEATPFDDQSNYFVISYIPLRRLLGNGPSQSVATIGSMKDVSDNGRLKIKCLHKATLLRISELQIQEVEQAWSQLSRSEYESSGILLIGGVLLDDDQDWCVI